jgi:hypothetical protein
MAYQPGDYVAIHAQPVWKEGSDFVFQIPIANDNGGRRWEQLWWRKLSETRFVLCCIPFFVYDLSLGDEAEVAVEVDGTRCIREITRRSGEWTFRAWFGDVSAELRDLAIARIGKENPTMEWSSANLVALSTTSERSQPMADVLADLEATGHLQYETGRTKDA